MDVNDEAVERKRRMRLSPDDRERVNSVTIHGMTSVEVGISCGVSPGTVRNLVSLFRRGRLDDFGRRRELFPNAPDLPKRGRKSRTIFFNMWMVDHG